MVGFVCERSEKPFISYIDQEVWEKILIGFVRVVAVSKKVYGYLNYIVLLFLHAKIKRFSMQI